LVNNAGIFSFGPTAETTAAASIRCSQAMYAALTFLRRGWHQRWQPADGGG
jgi:hypothetical protein